MSARSPDEDWQGAWQPVIAAVGQDWARTPRPAADRIEPGAIRRCLEVLEFDCPLHSSREAAQSAGFPEITVPYAATLAFAMAPMWQPGEILFDSDARDAQPEKSAVRPVFPDIVPPFSGYFATDMEMDFIRPAHVGERLVRRGERLLSCIPKETRVGRGAFLTFESNIETEHGEVVSRSRWTLFLYTPARGQE